MFQKLKKSLRTLFSKKMLKKVSSFYTKLETLYPSPLSIKESEKLLILAPHADDEIIGCGGLLLKYSSQCDVIVVTDGRYGDAEIQESVMVKIREEEFYSVMQELGVESYSSLAIEDTKLTSSYETFKSIEFKAYDYICIPNNLDQHPDHKALSKHIKKAYLEKRVHAKTKIVMYEVWGALALPNYFIDISQTKERKRELINLYASQVKHIDYASKILALNEYRGMTVNKESIEAYSIFRMKDFMDI